MGTGTIVTPEGVVLDFWIAGLGSRALAFAIDFVIRGVLFAAVAFAAAAVGFASSVVGIVILLVGIMVTLIGYPVALETLNAGRSIGQMVVGSRVVTIEGGPVRFRHSLIRALLAILDLFISVGAIAVVSALLTKRGQRLGDLVAGTMVIRERTADLSTSTQYFQASMDTSAMNTYGVSPELYQTTRDFLGRRYGMTTAARVDVATRLQNVLVPAVGVAPSPGTDPELFLSSVVAAVQVRDGVAPPAAAVASGTYSTATPPPPFGQVGASGQGPVQPPAPSAPPAWPQPLPAPLGASEPPPSPPLMPEVPAATTDPPAAPARPPASDDGGFSAPG